MNHVTKPYCYAYPRISLTVDAAVFLHQETSSALQILLIQRNPHRQDDPFAGMWALPGGFVEPNETVEQAVRREVEEETTLSLARLQQFHVFSDPKRDPREHVITVGFLTLLRGNTPSVCGQSDAADARWFSAEHLPPLAFDHAQIIAKALETLRCATHADSFTQRLA